MKRIPRRIFTEEFKKETVRLVQSEGLTMAEVARKMMRGHSRNRWPFVALGQCL